MEHESSAKARPKATHEVVVIRRDGTEEKVANRTLSDEEAHQLLEIARRQYPEEIARMEREALERRGEASEAKKEEE